MSRGVSPQKAFVMERLREVLSESDRLEGMQVRAADRNTLVLSVPSTVGPAAEYSITVREMMS